MPRKPHEVSDATMRLLLAAGIGPATLRRLRDRFGTDEEVVGASVSAISSITGIGVATATSLRRALDATDPEAERRQMMQRNASLILQHDEDFPSLLAVIDDAPPALWVRGEWSRNNHLAVAIVGSRNCTAYGREQAERFASLLSQAGVTIVSGGAKGIDGAAHRGASRIGGRTIAVMGCGLSIDYPGEHSELFESMVARGGALISEHPMSVPPKAAHFPRRNRIISGLSLGVLMIEAADRSGALITARLAAEEHHREVMALPGRVDSPASVGCHRAIRAGWASLVRTHADVLEQLDASSVLVRGALEQSGSGSDQSSLYDDALTDSQRTIVEALSESSDVVLIDQIAQRTSLPLGQIMADLTILQVHGRVSRHAQGVSLAR